MNLKHRENLATHLAKASLYKSCSCYWVYFYSKFQANMTLESNHRVKLFTWDSSIAHEKIYRAIKKNAVFREERNCMAGFKVHIEILCHGQHTKTTRGKIRGTPIFWFPPNSTAISNNPANRHEITCLIIHAYKTRIYTWLSKSDNSSSIHLSVFKPRLRNSQWWSIHGNRLIDAGLKILIRKLCH